MKIAFISQNFYPEEFSNNEIVAHLLQQGHDVTVTTAVPNYPKGRFFPGYSNFKNRREIWQGAQIYRAFTYPRGTSSVALILNYLVFAFFGIFTSLFLFISAAAPWFESWRQNFLETMPMSDHEYLNTCLACILLI